MNEENYFKVCNLSELKESFGSRFLINDTDIAVFKIGEKIFAVNNVCPHQQAALMFEGFVENETVVCPLHGWCFELETGNLCGGNRGLTSYPFKVIDSEVFVKVEE
ncbi:MAG: Rieske (2Fe-2S) protein, partial [Ignavibacteriae bacterium]|nr:Rieske (2Fe-2S) protein [Ignavibacteriota bacterium]